MNGKAKTVMLLALTLVLTVTGMLYYKPAIVKADGNWIGVYPPLYEAYSLGEEFTVKVNFTATNLAGFDYKLIWNNTLLNVTSYTITYPTDWPDTFTAKDEITDLGDGRSQHWLGVTSVPATGIDLTNYVMCTYTFKVLYVPTYPEPDITTTLDLYDTKFSDPDGNPIPHTEYDGQVTIETVTHILPHLYVYPSSIINPMLLPPANFSVDVMIANITDLYGYMFKLGYDTSILNCLGALIFPFANQTDYVNNIQVNDAEGFIWVNVTYYPPATSLNTTDPVSLARIFFQVAGLGDSVLDLNETKLINSFGGEIIHEVSDGYISILRHDVAVLNVVTSTNETYVGWNVKINVTVSNEGDATETFNVSVYCDDELIQTLTVTDLAPNVSTNLTFNWSTADAQPCRNYTIKAEAAVVPFETETENNVYFDGKVKIKMLGDVNGDGSIDLYDLVLCSNSFGCCVGYPCWDERVDFNQDGVIDIFDIVIIAANYGKVCQS